MALKPVISPLTYLYYSQYSTTYIVNFDDLNRYITDSVTFDATDIDQWIRTNCYYVLTSMCVDKIKHNLALAKTRHDTAYLDFLCDPQSHPHLHLEIDRDQWEYNPVKIKIKLKQPVPISGIKVSQPLMSLLQIPPDLVLTRKSAIIKLIHRYIYEHQLQNRYDRKVITPNAELSQCLTPLTPDQREYTYETLAFTLIGRQWEINTTITNLMTMMSLSLK